MTSAARSSRPAATSSGRSTPTSRPCWRTWRRPASRRFPPSARRRAAAEREEATSIDKHGDRIERRRLTVTTMLEGYLDWPHAARVGRLERAITAGGRTTVEVQCIVTSVPRSRADAATLLAWTRGHWGIENRLHYVRDVARGEDANRTRTGSGPQALAILRNLAITRLRLRKVTNIAAALRRNATRVANLIDDLRRLKN